ncbi:MAG: signal peptidase II [Candidatus Eisenbacteria bacterium]|nr:signal peptidase II [Candidatus Eisenbacteria bacterium]
MERSTTRCAGGPAANLRLFATALIIVVSDQMVKRVVVDVLGMGEIRNVWGTFLRLTRTENTGAAFGIFRGQSTWFIVISALAAAAIIFFRREIARMQAMHQLAFGLILGGALGNLIDRVRIGAVIDYLDIGVGTTRWPAFNIADSAITIGVVLLAVHLVFMSGKEPDGASTDAHESPERMSGNGEADDVA